MKRLKKKNLLLLATKLIEKIPDSTNAKEHYNYYLKTKNTKLVKLSEIITCQPKNLKNPKILLT